MDMDDPPIRPQIPSVAGEEGSGDWPIGPGKKRGIFAQSCFYMWGFAKNQTVALIGAVVSYEGVILNKLEDLGNASGFSWRLLVVPRIKRISDCPRPSAGIIIVTEWWLEACLYHKKFVKPSGDLTTMPIEEFEIEEMKGMRICVTNFADIDLLFYKRLILLLGAKFHDFLTSSRSLLITNDTRAKESEKLRFAHDSKIPVVTGEWLIDCLKQHCRLPYDDYLVKSSTGPSLLGDKFKRKRLVRELDETVSSKRLHVEDEGSSNVIEGESSHQPKFNHSGHSQHGSKTKKKRIMEGCTVCISKLLETRDDLVNIVKQLGGVVLESFDAHTSLTHFIHFPSLDPREIDPRHEDLEAACSIKGCWVVSPDWLHKSLKIGKLQDETKFLSRPANFVTAVQKEESPLQLSSLLQLDDRTFLHPRKLSQLVAPEDNVPRRSCYQVSKDDNSQGSHPLRRGSAGAAAVNDCLNPLGGSPDPLTSGLQHNTSSSLSGVSEILGRFEKEQIFTAAIGKPDVKKTRGKLQGKATAGGVPVARVFSRTPSASSLVGSGDSKGLKQPKAFRPTQEEPLEPENVLVPSQALGYNSEETTMEKKIVRAKLDKNAPLETPAKSKTRKKVPTRTGNAADQTPAARRSARKRLSTGGEGVSGF